MHILCTQSRPKHISWSYPSVKNTLFRELRMKKTPLSNQNRWCWGRVKHPLLCKTHFVYLYSIIKVPFLVKVRISVSNSRHLSMIVAFFVTSNVHVLVRDEIHLCITILSYADWFYAFTKWKMKTQMEYIQTFTLLSTSYGLMREKWRPFLDFVNTRLPFKKIPMAWSRVGLRV